MKKHLSIIISFLLFILITTIVSSQSSSTSCPTQKEFEDALDYALENYLLAPQDSKFTEAEMRDLINFYLENSDLRTADCSRTGKNSGKAISEIFGVASAGVYSASDVCCCQVECSSVTDGSTQCAFVDSTGNCKGIGGYTCSDSLCSSPQCTPKTCQDLGKECGTWDDKCGGKVTCGPCSVGKTCDYATGDCKESTPACGNSIKESGEECDGTDFGTDTCITKGFSGGDLICDSDCKISTTSCTSTPGDTCTKTGNRLERKDSNGGIVEIETDGCVFNRYVTWTCNPDQTSHAASQACPSGVACSEANKCQSATPVCTSPNGNEGDKICNGAGTSQLTCTNGVWTNTLSCLYGCKDGDCRTTPSTGCTEPKGNEGEKKCIKDDLGRDWVSTCENGKWVNRYCKNGCENRKCKGSTPSCESCINNGKVWCTKDNFCSGSLRVCHGVGCSGSCISDTSDCGATPTCKNKDETCDDDSDCCTGQNLECKSNGVGSEKTCQEKSTTTCQPSDCSGNPPSCPTKEESAGVCNYNGQAECIEGSTSFLGWDLFNRFYDIFGIKVCGWKCNYLKDYFKQCDSSVCTDLGWDNSGCGGPTPTTSTSTTTTTPSGQCTQGASCNAGETCCDPSSNQMYTCQCTSAGQSWQPVPVGQSVATEKVNKGEVALYNKCRKACKDKGYTGLGYCGAVLGCESGDKQICYGCYECTWFNLGPCCCSGEKQETHLKCSQNNVCTKVSGTGTDACSIEGSSCGGGTGTCSISASPKEIVLPKSGSPKGSIITITHSGYGASGATVDCGNGHKVYPNCQGAGCTTSCRYYDKGTFTVTATLTGGVGSPPNCGSTTIKVSIEGEGGNVTCPLKLDNVKAYPSPASTQATFEAEGQGIEKIRVHIYDLSGSEILDTGWQSGTTYSWDLKNKNGKCVADQSYKYKIDVKGCDDTKSSSQKTFIVQKGQGACGGGGGGNKTCTFQPSQSCGSQGCCGTSCCGGPPTTLPPPQPTTTTTTVVSTTTTTSPFTCPPLSCADILKNTKLRAAIIKYDFNNNKKIEDSEEKQAFQDYISGTYPDKNEMCAITSFKQLGCSLDACLEGGICSPKDSTCCDPATGKILKCSGGGVNPGSTTTTTASGCFDSDGGDNPNVKGYVKDLSGFTYTDKCSYSNTVLDEYTCQSNGYVLTKTYQCSCQDGACV